MPEKPEYEYNCTIPAWLLVLVLTSVYSIALYCILCLEPEDNSIIATVTITGSVEYRKSGYSTMQITDNAILLSMLLMIFLAATQTIT